MGTEHLFVHPFTEISVVSPFGDVNNTAVNNDVQVPGSESLFSILLSS